MLSPAPRPLAHAGDDDTVVGILLWRATPLGREIAVLDVDGYCVLPKGRVGEHEPEEEAARRLAARLAGARVRSAQQMAGPTSERSRLGWWTLRWGGLDPYTTQEPHVRWLATEEALVELDHRAERELAGRAAATWPERLHLRYRAWRARPARAILEEIDGLEEHARRAAHADREPARTVDPARTWPARALERAARARAALIDGDQRSLQKALAEARRAELYGLSAEERVLVAGELERAVEIEVDATRRGELRDRLRAPVAVERLVQVSRVLDEGRAARGALDALRRAERTELALVAGLALLGAWLFGSSAWFEAHPASEPPAPLFGVLLFGALGGAVSAMLAPGRVPHETDRGAPTLRTLLGATAALVVFTLARAGLVALPIASTPLWLALAFGAGFLERVLRHRSC